MLQIYQNANQWFTLGGILQLEESTGHEWAVCLQLTSYSSSEYNLAAQIHPIAPIGLQYCISSIFF